MICVEKGEKRQVRASEPFCSPPLLFPVTGWGWGLALGSLSQPLDLKPKTMLGWVAERLYCGAKGRAEGLLPWDSHAPSPARRCGDEPGRQVIPQVETLPTACSAPGSPRCFLRRSPDAHKASTGEAWAAPVPGSAGSSGGRRGGARRHPAGRPRAG